MPTARIISKDGTPVSPTPRLKAKASPSKRRAAPRRKSRRRRSLNQIETAEDAIRVARQEARAAAREQRWRDEEEYYRHHKSGGIVSTLLCAGLGAIGILVFFGEPITGGVLMALALGVWIATNR